MYISKQLSIVFQLDYISVELVRVLLGWSTEPTEEDDMGDNFFYSIWPPDWNLCEQWQDNWQDKENRIENRVKSAQIWHK